MPGFEFHDFVIGHVVAGPDQVVHSRVHQDQFLAAGVLSREDGGEQHSGAADEIASRFQHQREAGLARERQYRLREARRREWLLVAIPDAQPPTDVEVLERIHTGGSHPLHQTDQLGHALTVRSRVENLAADVHGDAVESEPRMPMNGEGQIDDLVERDPELDPALPRRDVGMGLCRHVRIHPNPYRNLPAQPVGDGAELREFVRRLEVDVSHAGDERGLEFGGRLPHPAEDNPARRVAGGEHPAHLPARDDIRPGAEVAKHPEHGEVAVGLDREADLVRDRAQRGVELPVLPADRIRVVDVGRRPRDGRHRRQPYPAEEEPAVAPFQSGVREQQTLVGDAPAGQ